MKCGKTRQRWHACLDEGRDDAEVDKHLASCDDCQRYVNLMSQIVGTLDELHEATEPVVATREFDPVARAVQGRRVHWNVAFRRLTGMAAAIAAVIGGWLYFATDRTPTVVGPHKPVTRLEDHGVLKPPEPADSRLGISLQGDSVGKFLVVSKETSEPDVQIYWLYPTVELADATGPL